MRVINRKAKWRYQRWLTEQLVRNTLVLGSQLFLWYCGAIWGPPLGGPWAWPFHALSVGLAAVYVAVAGILLYPQWKALRSAIVVTEDATRRTR